MSEYFLFAMISVYSRLIFEIAAALENAFKNCNHLFGLALPIPRLLDVTAGLLAQALAQRRRVD
jgi:hypothetical protein